MPFRTSIAFFLLSFDFTFPTWDISFLLYHVYITFASIFCKNLPIFYDKISYITTSLLIFLFFTSAIPINFLSLLYILHIPSLKLQSSLAPFKNSSNSLSSNIISFSLLNSSSISIIFFSKNSGLSLFSSSSFNVIELLISNSPDFNSI